MKSSAPLVFVFVLSFAFLLLLVSFRSIVIPIKAIVMNLLSVGAAYGLLVATFQWGWGSNLLDFQKNGGIASWLPMFLFVILFGLSMDYHVFILSRVKEYYDRGLCTEQAVEKGIRSTAGVVTSAAVVMVFVFGVFALMPIIDMKEMGIGLAAAVLIDATIVRAVLLPATMKLLGEWNWYLPTWLEWLPTLEHERSADSPVIDGRAGARRRLILDRRLARRRAPAAPGPFVVQHGLRRDRAREPEATARRRGSRPSRVVAGRHPVEREGQLLGIDHAAEDRGRDRVEVRDSGRGRSRAAAAPSPSRPRSAVERAHREDGERNVRQLPRGDGAGSAAPRGAACVM